MKEYQPFPISNARTGFIEALEPWLAPRDGFQVMKNAHLYRGVVEGISGYDIYAKMSYRYMTALTVGAIDGANKTFSGVLNPRPTTNNFYAYSSTSTTGATAEKFTYASDGVAPVLNLTGSNGGFGTVNITTGAVSITFGATAPQMIPGGGNVYNSVLFAWDGATSNSPAQPIMGIKPYYSASGAQDILVFDTKRVGKVVLLQGTMQSTVGADQGISELLHSYYVSALFTGTGAGFTSTGNLGATMIYPGSVIIYQFTSAGVPVAGGNITDNGAGSFTGTNVNSALSWINYNTGAYTITLTASTLGNVFDSSVGVYGNLFTGDKSNFFSYSNNTSNFLGYAFFTNNFDRPMYYDGSVVRYLNTNLSVKLTSSSSGVPGYDISRALHVVSYRERLVLLNVIVDGNNASSSAYWSKALLPLDFTNGEFLQASTSEPIRTFSIINTNLIVRFARSERILTYTGDAFAPFRWDSTNLLWRCDAPYSAINYDSDFSSVGRPAIVSSDGVNVTRADEIIPDFTFPGRIEGQIPVIGIDQASIIQCYGERFDDFKEGWLCFKSFTSDQTQAVQASDSVLAYNYLDGTYAVYTFPFSCLGFGSVLGVETWGTSERTWESARYNWATYFDVQGALIDLAGDHVGNVFELGSSNTTGISLTGNITGVSNTNPGEITSIAHGLITGQYVYLSGIVVTGVASSPLNGQIVKVTVTGTDSYTFGIDTTNTGVYGTYASGGTWALLNPVLMDVITKNFNPFIEDGQLSRLGYVDFLVTGNNQTTVRVQFFKDDQLYLDANGNPAGYYQETTLTFSQTTPNSSLAQTKVWKRVYVGSVAKEHTIRIYQNINDFTPTTLHQPCRIHAIVPYFKPAGRIFN